MSKAEDRLEKLFKECGKLQFTINLHTAAHVLKEIKRDNKDWFRKMWNRIVVLQKAVKQEEKRMKN